MASRNLWMPCGSFRLRSLRNSLAVNPNWSGLMGSGKYTTDPAKSIFTAKDAGADWGIVESGNWGIEVPCAVLNYEITQLHNYPIGSGVLRTLCDKKPFILDFLRNYCQGKPQQPL